MESEDATGLKNKPKRMFWIAATLGLFLVLFVATIFFPEKPHGYRFLTADHPVDRVSDGSGTWTYYFVGGLPSLLAERARAELLPKGYREDESASPWYRFRNGVREVIICNHDEIATDSSLSGTTLSHGRKNPSGFQESRKDAVVWIREPGSNLISLAAFKVKKTVLLW